MHPGGLEKGSQGKTVYRVSNYHTHLDHQCCNSLWIVHIHIWTNSMKTLTLHVGPAVARRHQYNTVDILEYHSRGNRSHCILPDGHRNSEPGHVMSFIVPSL